jgi:hypothetical protein
MDISKLTELVEQPQVHQQLLGSYRGAYSLGIGKCPDTGEPCFALRVTDSNTRSFPKAITIDTETIPVLVVGGFSAPKPLGAAT